MADRAWATEVSSTSSVRALAPRSSCLTFDQAGSMGLKSGEYDLLPDSDHLVGRQIVHDHDLAGLQSRAQPLLQIGQKHLSIGRRFHRHRRQQPIYAERSQYRQGVPVSCGRAFPHALAARGWSVATGHFGGHSALVEKHQVARVDLLQRLPPELPPRLDFWALLLLRVE